MFHTHTTIDRAGAPRAQRGGSRESRVSDTRGLLAGWRFLCLAARLARGRDQQRSSHLGPRSSPRPLRVMTWTVRLLLLLLLPATASALELSSMPPCCTEAKPELNRMGRCAQIAIRGRCDVNLKADKNRTLRAICPVSSARCSNSPHTKHANRRYCITYTSMADLACVRTTNQRRLRVAHAQSASRIRYAPCIG